MDPAIARSQQATMLRPGNKLPSIQVLRGLAASLVVFHHFCWIIEQYGTKPSWIIHSGLGAFGACGVDLFFVISGFIMVYTTTKKAGPSDALDFLRKRVLRIYPLYWLWTTALLALWLVGIALKSHHYSASFLVQSYLLIPAFNDGNYQPFLTQGWTLSFEMLFYLVFSCAILLSIKRRKLWFLGGAFVVLFLISLALPAHSGIRYLLSEPIIIEFLFGALAAEVLFRLPAASARWMRILPVLLITVGVIALLATLIYKYPDYLRFAAWGIPALLILAGAATLGPMPENRFLVYLGDASYSIYLVHAFFTIAYGAAFKHFHGLAKLSPDVTIIVGGLVTIVLSSLSYPLVERHLTAALSPKRRVAKETPVIAPSAPGDFDRSVAVGDAAVAESQPLH